MTISNSVKNIAIIGATSHIAKGIIWCFNKQNNVNLFLFARNPEKINLFLKNEKINLKYFCGNFEQFPEYNYDCIINCVGIGRNDYIKNVFDITEKHDNLIISYLEKNQNSLYINFSSGAVYSNFDTPAKFDSEFSLKVNDIQKENFYSIAKIHSEAKHRALNYLNIVDIRVFSYFSRFIDLNSNFLITEIINSIKNNNLLKTNSEDIIRDYSNPTDLFLLIQKCIEKNKINDCFDLYSKSPVNKFELLEFYSVNYGLKYTIENNSKILNNSTGYKNFYCSNNYKAKTIGFEPQYSSINTINIETKFII